MALLERQMRSILAFEIKEPEGMQLGLLQLSLELSRLNPGFNKQDLTSLEVTLIKIDHRGPNLSGLRSVERTDSVSNVDSQGIDQVTA